MRYRPNGMGLTHDRQHCDAADGTMAVASRAQSTWTLIIVVYPEHMAKCLLWTTALAIAATAGAAICVVGPRVSEDNCKLRHRITSCIA